MEFVKKALPVLIIAIAFAVGGYFIGHSDLNNQAAAIYEAKTVATDSKIVATFNWGKWCYHLRENGTAWTSKGPCPALAGVPVLKLTQ